jgi:uncharacterized protein Yka (UPF0111/DUF47 family)
MRESHNNLLEAEKEKQKIIEEIKAMEEREDWQRRRLG